MTPTNTQINEQSNSSKMHGTNNVKIR